jgi:hypothetical protein
MSFLNVNMRPDRIVEELAVISTLLSRITLALERLSPEIPEAYPSRPATLSDLRDTSISRVNQVKSALDLYAAEHGVVVNSDLFIRSIKDFERQVIDAYGPEAILDLPWNKAAGGPIFQDHANQAAKDPIAQAADNRTDASQSQARVEATDAKRKAGPTSNPKG